MLEINLPPEEVAALRAIDTRALGQAIDACLDARRGASSLRENRLDSCGLYVASKLRAFETALAAYAGAKSAKKLADTESRARRAGSDLVAAVQNMQHRVETQEKERKLFFVEDHIIPPGSFSKQLSVPVRYSWRPTPEAEWIYGTITFSHTHDPRPDYRVSPPKRKPSAAKQERDQQDELWRQWEQLRDRGLESVATYLREGRDGAAIPQSFQARVDPYDRHLNNFSCRFWLEPAGTTT
ncbi:hypothetical protein [Xanthomonas campestris]|uniref:hypothetical protein n=1 Tax=Xanthomonas campestris TaxID=339 RepID=UPI001C856BE9|nr:hypothetical protein [Xanthomonas campestris]MCC5053892.1 hypothetical protein [Xanthomonas campestris pv. aberrans]MDM7685147.1 hypothetical protein [Xanthomonas campestris pv. campestris]MDM7689535.1 hypothetical protein [Xanthomonas campestris pv. campestris]MEB1128300.1 hypothetical protein [Xanthomonas campestris pv. campestris]